MKMAIQNIDDVFKRLPEVKWKNGSKQNFALKAMELVEIHEKEKIPYSENCIIFGNKREIQSEFLFFSKSRIESYCVWKIFNKS